MRKRHKFQPDSVCHSLAAKAHADRYEPVEGMKLVEEVRPKEYIKLDLLYSFTTKTER